MNDEIKPGFPGNRPPEPDDEDEAAAEEPTAEAETDVAAEEPTQEAAAGRPRRVLRSSNDRVVAGVAGGLGAYFGVDPLIVRIGFALSIFFGGLGILAYLLLAIFVPRDDDPEGTEGLGTRFRGGGFLRGVGLVVVILLGIALLFCLAGGAAFAVAIGWGVPTAVVVIAIGALLVLAAFRGGGARWLIPPAVALALGASVAAASDVDFTGGIGERGYRPLSEASIPADGYRLGVGEMVIDLRELEWRQRDVVELETSMGAGLTAIYVPERVCVSAETQIDAGSGLIAGERNEGLDVSQSVQAGSTATPRLELDAELDFGELWVINSDTALPTGERGPGWHGSFEDGDSFPLRATQERACATG